MSKKTAKKRHSAKPISMKPVQSVAEDGESHNPRDRATGSELPLVLLEVAWPWHVCFLQPHGSVC